MPVYSSRIEFVTISMPGKTIRIYNKEFEEFALKMGTFNSSRVWIFLF